MKASQPITSSSEALHPRLESEIKRNQAWQGFFFYRELYWYNGGSDWVDVRPSKSAVNTTTTAVHDFHLPVNTNLKIRCTLQSSPKATLHLERFQTVFFFLIFQYMVKKKNIQNCKQTASKMTQLTSQKGWLISFSFKVWHGMIDKQYFFMGAL